MLPHEADAWQENAEIALLVMLPHEADAWQKNAEIASLSLSR
jgi:hypothetical protein